MRHLAYGYHLSVEIWHNSILPRWTASWIQCMRMSICLHHACSCAFRVNFKAGRNQYRAPRIAIYGGNWPGWNEMGRLILYAEMTAGGLYEVRSAVCITWSLATYRLLGQQPYRRVPTWLPWLQTIEQGPNRIIHISSRVRDCCSRGERSKEFVTPKVLISPLYSYPFIDHEI